MKSVQKSLAVFVVPPHVHLLDMGGPAQVFHEAIEEGAPLALEFVSMHALQSEIPSSCGINFTSLKNYKNLSLTKGDIVFIPGLEFQFLVDAEFLSKTKGFLKWLAVQHANGATICSICTVLFY